MEALLVEKIRRQLQLRPIQGAVAVGIAFAVMSLTVSGLTLFLLHHWLLPEYRGASAGSELLRNLSDTSLFLLAVVFIPPFETLIGQVFPMEVVRRLRGGTTVCVIASAGVFGFGHFVNGGVAHGISSFTAGLVFACSYSFVRRNGVVPGFAAACTTHATHNFVMLFVIANLFPQWA